MTVADGATATIDSVLSGTVTGFEKAGPGTLVLGASNSYTGGSRLEAGHLQINSGSSLGSGDVAFAGGTLELAAGTATLNQALSFEAASGRLLVGSGATLTVGGATAGAAGLVKTGSGTLVLAGNNLLHQGGTDIQGGVLRLTGNLNSDGVNVRNGGRLDLAGGNLNGATVNVFAGGVLLAVMTVTALTAKLGSPAAGRTAAASSTARAAFGRSLVSSLDAIRTVKLSAATSDVHRHLRHVDGGRIDAAVREHRVQSILDGVPVVLVQAGVVAAWAIHVAGWWDLSTTLLVSGVVVGFEWFGRVAGSVVTEAPGTQAWQQHTSRLAGGCDLMDLPAGVDLVVGTGLPVEPGRRDRLERLDLVAVSAVHDDGTIGAVDVSFSVERGETVLVLGRVGSGKSSLLGALAGLVHSTGSLRWNGVEIEPADRELVLRPGRVSFVGQRPRVLSGTFADNVLLDHDRALTRPIEQARLARDVADAGGPDALVGHRGVRLSGGQVQRLALARALAVDAELLVVDDVSSALDAATEVELWDALRAGGHTVIGATSKRSALERADRVVVLLDGEVAAQGRWADLAATWSHLAG